MVIYYNKKAVGKADNSFAPLAQLDRATSNVYAKQHSALFCRCEMSGRIRCARTVTEAAVILTADEKVYGTKGKPLGKIKLNSSLRTFSSTG